MDDIQDRFERLFGRPFERIELSVVRVPFSGYPLYGFFYDADGHHRGGLEIVDERHLDYVWGYMVRPAAFEKGREVRITDKDDFMVWWAKNGVVIHDGFTEGVTP